MTGFSFFSSSSSFVANEEISDKRSGHERKMEIPLFDVRDMSPDGPVPIGTISLTHSTVFFLAAGHSDILVAATRPSRHGQ